MRCPQGQTLAAARQPGTLHSAEFSAASSSSRTPPTLDLEGLRDGCGGARHSSRASEMLLAADAGGGEEITDAGSVGALRMDEQFLPLQLPGVKQPGGGGFVPIGVGFKTDGVGH